MGPEAQLLLDWKREASWAPNPGSLCFTVPLATTYEAQTQGIIGNFESATAEHATPEVRLFSLQDLHDCTGHIPMKGAPEVTVFIKMMKE